MKTCKKCLVEKQLLEFYKNKECSLGRENICKQCRNEHTVATRDKTKHSMHQRKYYSKNADVIRSKERGRYYTEVDKRKNSFYLARYNISLSEAIEMLEQQSYICKICSTGISLEVNAPNTGHVDHCHTTGKVRGILCSSCNTGLGLFRDNTVNLQKAIEYLNETKQESNE